LWPSELKQFQEAVESTKHRLADGASTERLNIAISQANGVDGARSLSSWADQQKQLLSYVSDETKRKVNLQVSAKVDELLEQPLRQEADAVGKIGDGVRAVVAGNSWYHHLTETYGFAAGRPAYEAALERLKSRRAADLAAAQPVIIAEIGKQSKQRDVDNVQAKYLVIPGDNGTASAAAIMQAANARKKAIQHEEALAYYSPHERQWLRPDGTFATPRNYSEPDEDDLRVAVVRSLEMRGAKRVGPATVILSTPLTEFLPTNMILTVNRVERLAFSPAGGGFLVRYRPHLTGDYAPAV
jgi:hypothetical protein